MPSHTKKTVGSQNGQRGNRTDDEEKQRKKEALQLSNQIKKESKKLKLKQFTKIFEDEVSKFKEFDAEFQLLRLELLARALNASKDSSTMDPKRKSEMREIVMALKSQHICWAYGMERCCAIVCEFLCDYNFAADLASTAIIELEKSRPTDDKMFFELLASKDEEDDLKVHSLLNLDYKEDVGYLTDRLRRLQLHARHMIFQEVARLSNGSLFVPQDLSNLNIKVNKRRQELGQLYRQGLRAPIKKSNGSKESGPLATEEAKRIKRQLIEQEVVRAKALALCSQANQIVHVNEEVVEMQTSKVVKGAANPLSERLQRKLAAKKEVGGRSEDFFHNFGDSVVEYINRLDEDDLSKFLQIETDRLKSVISSAQVQDTVQSSILQHVLFNALENQTAKFLGRWYDNETQNTDRSLLLPLLKSILWRATLQTAKKKVVQRVQEGSLKLEYPWKSDLDAAEDRLFRMKMFLHNDLGVIEVSKRIRFFQSFLQKNDAIVPVESVLEQCTEDSWMYMVETNNDTKVLDDLCHSLFREKVRVEYFDLQCKFDCRFPIFGALNANNVQSLDSVLTFNSDLASSSNEFWNEYMLSFVMDRYALDPSEQWLLVHWIVQEVDISVDEDFTTRFNTDLHIVENSAMDGFKHIPGSGILEFNADRNGLKSQRNSEFLIEIVKMAEKGKEIETHQVEICHEKENSNPSCNPELATNQAQAQFRVHGRSLSEVLKHYERDELEKRENFRQALDASIQEALRWSAHQKIFWQVEALSNDLTCLRNMLSTCLSNDDALIESEEFILLLRDMENLFHTANNAASDTRQAHLFHSDTVLRSTLSILRQHTDVFKPLDKEIQNFQGFDMNYTHILEYGQKVVQTHSTLMSLKNKVLNSPFLSGVSASVGFDGRLAELTKLGENSIKHQILYSRATTMLDNIDKMYGDMQKVFREVSNIGTFDFENYSLLFCLHDCKADYSEMIRNICICIIRENVLTGFKLSQEQEDKRLKEEGALKAVEDLLKGEELLAEQEKLKRDRLAKRKAKEKEKKQKREMEELPDKRHPEEESSGVFQPGLKEPESDILVSKSVEEIEENVQEELHEIMNVMQPQDDVGEASALPLDHKTNMVDSTPTITEGDNQTKEGSKPVDSKLNNLNVGVKMLSCDAKEFVPGSPCQDASNDSHVAMKPEKSANKVEKRPEKNKKAPKGKGLQHANKTNTGDRTPRNDKSSIAPSAAPQMQAPQGLPGHGNIPRAGPFLAMNPAMCGPPILPTNMQPFFMGIPTGIRPILHDGRMNEMPIASSCPPMPPMGWNLHPNAMCAIPNPAMGMHCPPVGLHGSPINNQAGVVPWGEAEGFQGNVVDHGMHPAQLTNRPSEVCTQQVDPKEQVNDDMKVYASAAEETLKEVSSVSSDQSPPLVGQHEPKVPQQTEGSETRTETSIPARNAWTAAGRKAMEDGSHIAAIGPAAGDAEVATAEVCNSVVSPSHSAEQASKNEDSAAPQLPGIYLRPEQCFGTREYGQVWGATHGEALDKNAEISAKDLGKGLDNPKGEFNCFLNVIIQSLWQLESFRDALLKAAETSLKPDDHTEAAAFLRSLAKVFSSLSGSKSGVDVVTEGASKAPASSNAWASGPPALVSAPAGNAWGGGGKNLFVVDPTECRKALSSILMSRNRAQVQEMADASEALNDILETLQPLFEQSASASSSGSDDATPSNMVFNYFGLKVKEGLRCCKCGYKMQEHSYTRYFHYVPPKLLADVHMQLREQKSSPEDLLREAYARDTRTCPGCKEGNARFECSQSLFSSPEIFSLVLAWETMTASSDEISLLFHQIPLVVDLASVYSGVQGDLKYRLRCMVCFYGQHYVLLSYKPRVKEWVQYDDSSVKRVGDWKDVAERCRLGRFQPNVLFYEKCS
eukprot:762003-Hanusia_phi.AAC.1